MKAEIARPLGVQGIPKIVRVPLVCLLSTLMAIPGYSDTAFSSNSIVYGYDEDGRLVQATYQSGQSYRYVYDAANNIVSLHQSNQADRDGDFLPDSMEKTDSCPYIDDADSDDDGIPDGWEDKNQNGLVDPGETDPCNPDTDGDGIQDGTELGYTTPVPDPDGAGPLKGTDTAIFKPDADPASRTNPLSKDTNGNGVHDGVEDTDRNGRVDAGESNPAVVLSKSISGALYGTGGTPFTTPVILRAYSGTSCSGLQVEASTRSEAGTGAYVFENLTRDSYYILAEPSGTDILPTWYTAAGEAYECTAAQPISLSAVPQATGRNIRLNPAASISGTVLEVGGAVPEADDIYMKVYVDNACTGALVKTAPFNQADGRFTVHGLNAGIYFVQADTGASLYQAEWWASGGDAFACANAEAITVAAGAPIDAIDVRLDKGGRISGTLYKSNGTTILTGETILVEAYAAGACSQEPIASGFVNETTGSYIIGGLKAGNYNLKAKKSYSGTYIEEWWSTAGNAFNCLQAGAVAITASEVAADMNFQLDTGGMISGTLFEADGVTPVTTPLVIEFYLYQSGSGAAGACGARLVTFTNQDANGQYRQTLPPGNYFTRINPMGTDYAFSWWVDSGAISTGTISCKSANSIKVEAGVAAPVKNFRLRPAITISGHLYESNGVTPVSGPVQVIAYSDNPCDAQEVTRGSYNPATGEYVVNNLRNGNFTVFVDAEGTSHADEWWSQNGNAFFCFQATTITTPGRDNITGRDIVLDTGTPVSGTVYKKDGLTPIDQAIPIGLYPENACGSYSKIKTVTADPATGQYAFTRQGPGSYTLLADPAAASIYADEWWSQGGDAFVCKNAEVFTLTAGGAQTGKDFKLDTESTISGTLYKPDSAVMNQTMSVQLYTAGDCQTTLIQTVSSNRNNGTFSFTGVPPGRYHIFVNSNYNVYASEWHSQAGDAFTCAAASEIVVPSGENVANLVIHMNTGSKISGTLYKEDGVTPVTDNTRVYLYRGDPCNPETLTYVNTTSGAYEIDALQPGTYYLMTSMSYYYDHWWSPTGNAQGCLDAQPVNIANIGDIITTTNFKLKERGAISGKVYQLDGVTPVTGTMIVYLFNNANLPCTTTGVSSVIVSSSDGSYKFRGLDAGTYFLWAVYGYSNYMQGWWSRDGITFDCNAAEGITLTEGQQVTDRNFSLHEKISISGKVLKEDQTVIDSETIYVRYYTGASSCTANYRGSVAVNSSDGTYTIRGPEAGTYFLKTTANNPETSLFIHEWWSGSGHTFDCSGAAGIPIELDQSTQDKDFGLYDCTNFPYKAVNDNFDQAIVLTGASGLVTTNNYCASAESGEPDHSGAGEGSQTSLWWRWTAPETGTVIFKTENSSFLMTIAVYTGNAVNALTIVAANTRFEQEEWSRVAFKAEKGQTYAVAIDKPNSYNREPGLISLAYEGGATLPGDVNSDSVVDLRDAIIVLQIPAKLADTGSDAGADVNADGRIGLAEAIYILQKIANLR